MIEMQVCSNKEKTIEQSVKDHDPKSEYAIEKYLKENNLELNTKDTDKIIELGVQLLEDLRTSLKEQDHITLQTQ
ncbi:MAG: hypothetical protein CM15mV18_0710 [uncultured marine virus]|nr:MAG: hypothetical protein CM15mV18_0710 [uncultured marine virus]